MEFVAEDGIADSFDTEGDVMRLHTLVAGAAVVFDGKCFFAVMAGAAGFSLIHFSHGYIFFFTGYDLAVMTAFTAYT
jgi:hypothetical protein